MTKIRGNFAQIVNAHLIVENQYSVRDIIQQHILGKQRFYTLLLNEAVEKSETRSEPPFVWTFSTIFS